LKFGEQFEEETFELLVGAIDFVDQQNGGARSRGIDRLEQRPLDEKRFAVKLSMGAGTAERLGRIENSQFQQLARVVPLVQRMTDIESFVTLQTNQVGAERSRGRRGKGRLADAGFTLEKERPLEAKRQEQ
jgi:hypothetical protein